MCQQVIQELFCFHHGVLRTFCLFPGDCAEGNENGEVHSSSVIEDMGHPQPPTLVHCDNSTAVGIANNTVKRQRSCSMEMRFLWVADAVKQGKFDIKYYPGKENLPDYQSKHLIGAHHTAVRQWYLHKLTSICELPRADKPSTLKGCVGTLKDGYICNVPLPRVPRIQSTSTPTTLEPSRCIPKGTAPSRCIFPSGKHLPPYFGIPVRIPTLRRVIKPAIARVRTPW